MSSGINLPRISPRHLIEFDVPLPPLDEQRRIAAILDQADVLRGKRREALAALETLEPAAMLELLGAPEENPNQFDVVEFGELIADGPTNGLYKPASAYGEGTPILRINNFYDGRIIEPEKLRRLRVNDTEQRRFLLREDDIVINRVNSDEFLGKSVLIPRLSEPTVFESNMMRISLDTLQINPRFCIAFLQTKFIKKQIATAKKDAVNQSSINQSDVRQFRFLLPPLTDQRKFAVMALRFEESKDSYTAQLRCLNFLFASLQHRAFRGEL